MGTKSKCPVCDQSGAQKYPSLYRSVIHVYCKESRCWELLLYQTKWELSKGNATEPVRKGGQKGGGRTEVRSQEGIMYVLQSVLGTL